MNSDCIFCRIGSGHIPVETLYEDDEFVAVRDINPQAPIHALVIPRKHYDSLMDATDHQFLGKAMLAVQATALALNIQSEGFRTVINCRDNGGQTIPHLHVHILGGRFMHWPPG